MSSLAGGGFRRFFVLRYDCGRVVGGVCLSADEERFLTEENVYYNTAPHGFISFGEFMQGAGLIEEVPGSRIALVYPNLKNADGS